MSVLGIEKHNNKRTKNTITASSSHDPPGGGSCSYLNDLVVIIFEPPELHCVRREDCHVCIAECNRFGFRRQLHACYDTDKEHRSLALPCTSLPQFRHPLDTLEISSQLLVLHDLPGKF